MKIVFASFSLILTALAFNGCMDGADPYDPYAKLQEDIRVIDNYLDQQAIDAQKDVNGVRIDIHYLGDGLPAGAHNTTDVMYAGKVFGGSAFFETGRDTGRVDGYIAGWQIALKTLPAGTQATVYIPSPLGYGQTASDKIPANSILVFDIDFKSVVMSTTEKNRFKADTTAIESYLTEKQIAAVTDPTGVRYTVTQTGDGATPSYFDKLKLKMVLKLLSDDTKTAATVDRAPSESFLSRVVDQNIPGLVAVLTKLPVGSKATVYLPSGLAFGGNTIYSGGQAVIPANANVIVELELLEIVP